MKTIFFAAGATVPFFGGELTTESITKYVCDGGNWARIINKYKKISNRNFGEELLCANPYGYIKRLKRSHNGDKLNFEDIAEVIDKTGSYAFDDITSHNIFNLTIKMITNVSNEFVGWDKIPFLYRELIAECFLNVYKNHKKTETYKSLKNKQREFIKYVQKGSNGKLSLISLNYDPCVPDSIQGLNIDNCFDKEGLFDEKKFMFCDNVIYYPHGHLCFRLVDDNHTYYYKTANIAERERWGNLASINLGATQTNTGNTPHSAYNFNTFITTGRNKDESLNRLPYSAYYQRLAMDFWNSDTIYIIGYSFGDEHFNRFIKNYIACEKGNVIIVDYVQPTNPEPTKIYDLSANVFYHKIRELIKEDSRLNDAQMNLEEIGVGNLSEKVKLYLKGYDVFLEEMHWI